MPRSFDSVFYGAAGGGEDLPSDDEFNRVSFLSHFEGSNNGVNNAFDDGSSSNHTITANGNVTQGSFGPFARPDGEWAWSFDGTTAGYISVPTDTDFDFTNATTLEFWVNIPEDQTDVLVLGRHNMYWFGADYAGGGGSANKFSWLVAPTGGAGVAGWSVIHSSADIVYNQWYFVQLIYSGTTVTFYLDGSSQGTITSFTPHVNESKPFYVGGYAAQFNAHAIVSNIRFSNVARATTVPTSAFSVDSNTKLLLCSNNRFTDRSSQAATVSAYAGASVTAFGPILTSSVYDAAVNGASLATPAAGDYLSFGNIGLDGHSGDFSIEAWIYPTSYSQYSNTIYGQGGPGSISDLLEISLNSSGQPHAFINQGSVTLQSTFVCPKNAWTFVQLKRTSGTLAIFINGVQSSTVSNTATIGTPNRSFVGTQSYDAGASTRSFYGFICDVRASVVTRSVSLPTAPLAVTDSNTKLLLNMADGQAIDSAAQNNLTLHGTAKLSTGQAKFGDTSILFDGNSDFASFPHSSSNDISGAGNWTVEFFWRFVDNDATQFQEIATKGSGFQIYGDNGALSIALSANNNTSYFLDNTGGTTLSDNTWYHIAVVKNGTAYNVYLDGTNEANLDGTSSSNVSTGTSPWNLGAVASNSLYANGYMDEFRVSQFARYTSNFTAPTEPFADKGQDA